MDEPVGVGIAGLGAVGGVVAERTVQDLHGYRLAAVAARRRERAQERLAALGADVPVVPIEDLSQHADLVVEALPAELFRTLMVPTVEQGKRAVVLSAGALLEHWDLVDLAGRTGAQILVPSGAILGIDAMLAAVEGHVESVRMVTRKPARAVTDAPFLKERGISLEGADAPVELFRGTAREAIVGFPANLNVAVALSLAGPGPDGVHLEVWADPHLEGNAHRVEVVADAARFEFSIENVLSEHNPRTGRITAQSVVALLRKLNSPLRVGT